MVHPFAAPWRRLAPWCHLAPGRLAAVSAVVCLIVVACGPSTASPVPPSSSVAPSGVVPTSSADQAVACDTTATTATQPASPPAAPASPPAAAPPSNAAPWWRDRVFYEVFVRSFADSNGDGIGDLRGLTERLDYLNDGDPATTDDLGVTALWLMPVAESPSYHGYDVTDYKAIEADYGTEDDFRALIAAAHERGIDVVVDLVLNHSSSQHPWFEDARTPGSVHDDWYVWSNTDPGVTRPGGSPVWHRDGDRWYYGYFGEGMPDLNLANPAVSSTMDDVAAFWLDDLGVDGFRLDAAKHLIEDGATLTNTPSTLTWLEDFRSRVKTEDPEALLVGEVWDTTSISSEYVRAGALDMTFAFELAAATLSAVRLGDPGSLAHVQAEVATDYPPGGYAAFLTNHDQNRTMDVLARDPVAAALAATLLLTGAGVPFLYYGEELGMRGRKPDEEIRTPLAWDATEPAHGFTTGEPWEAFAPDADAANVATQTDDPRSLLAHYRSLIGLRATHAAFRDGELIPMDDATAGVYAYLRHAGDETIAVVANLTDEPIDDASLTLVKGPLCGQPTAEVLLGRAGPAVAGPVVNAAGGFDGYVPVRHLEPRQAVVLRLNP